MVRWILLLAAICVGSSAYAQSTNYSFASSNYSATTPFVAPCVIGPCANYAQSMHVTGFLTIGPGQGVSSPATYSFFDGLNIYSSSDPNTRVVYWSGYALQSGQIGQLDVSLQLWQTGTNPHVTGDRYAVLNITNGQVTVRNNQLCSRAGLYVIRGLLAYDACLDFSASDNFQSQANNGTDGTGAWSLVSAPPAPASLTIVSGSGQSADVNTPFAQPLVVRVQDSNGHPLVNVPVTWSTPAPGPSAAVSPSSALTDANGTTSTTAIANGTAGSYAVSAYTGALRQYGTLTNTVPTSIANCSGRVTTTSALVEQYYVSILRRPSDGDGKAFWIGEADRLCNLGADLKQTFFLLANVFFNSPEYLAFNRNDSDFVSDLYATFFGRAPDTAGLNYWTGQLAQGMPRGLIMSAFLFSPEFAATMNALFPGSTARAESYLVLNLYGGLFRRLADSSGYGYWDTQFIIAECSSAPAATINATISTVSGALIRSSEYSARGTSNSQYIQDLYYALLQRAGDLGGFNYWVDLLDRGTESRDQVRQQFLQSTEMRAQNAAMAAQGCTR